MATATEPVVYHGMKTPWGKADTARIILPGMGMVNTPGHGGIKLSAERNRKIPTTWRLSSGWYEEDCECNIPFHFFRDEIMASTDPKFEWLRTGIAKHDPLESLKGWWWQKYEEYFKCTLAPGESYSKDEYMFVENNRNNFVVRSAVSVGDNTVKVWTRRASDGAEKVFLVPSAEYIGGRFVADLARHAELPEEAA